MQRKENPQVSTLIGNWENFTYWTPSSTIVLISSAVHQGSKKVVNF